MKTSKIFYPDLMNIYLEVGNFHFEVILANIQIKTEKKDIKIRILKMKVHVMNMNLDFSIFRTTITFWTFIHRNNCFFQVIVSNCARCTICECFSVLYLHYKLLRVLSILTIIYLFKFLLVYCIIEVEYPMTSSIWKQIRYNI